MAIPLTTIHADRVVNQITQNLTGLQRDMVRNANTHKAMATAQSPPLATLQAFVADSAQEYLRRLQWLIDLRNDPVRRQRMVNILNQRGWTEADITDVATPLRQAAIALRDAPRSTYAEIITACNNLLATVDPPDSLWPE